MVQRSEIPNTIDRRSVIIQGPETFWGTLSKPSTRIDGDVRLKKLIFRMSEDFREIYKSELNEDELNDWYTEFEIDEQYLLDLSRSVEKPIIMSLFTWDKKDSLLSIKEKELVKIIDTLKATGKSKDRRITSMEHQMIDFSQNEFMNEFFSRMKEWLEPMIWEIISKVTKKGGE